VGKTEKVVSVDNTYIASIDLSSWSPRVRVTGVKEDSDFYYVVYVLSTIDIKDYKWQNVDVENTLKVDKKFLEEFKSLEAYVKYELAQKIDAEKDRLARTQEIEKKNVTQIQTVTSYTGLAGLVLDDTTTVGDPFAPAPPSETPGVPNTTPAPVVPVQETPVTQEPVQNLPTTTPAVPTGDTATETQATTTTPVIDTSFLNASTTAPTTTQEPATTTPEALPASDPTPVPVEPTPVPEPVSATEPAQVPLDTPTTN
jgi:hypothetical protein